MNPLLEMRALLEGRLIPQSGTVVEVAGSAVKVRTFRGVLDVRSADATVYVVGDEVLFKDGIVKGKLKPLSAVEIYHV
jgi:hypothetical protein